MKKLLVSRALTDDVMTTLKASYDVTLRPTTQPMDASDATAALMAYDAVLPTLGDDFGTEVFDKTPEPQCKILANFGVGYNHIDTAAAARVGITVTNTPGAVTDATADIAITLMLMVARRAGQGERHVRSGAWLGWHPVQILGMHLAGKTVGIIGMGRIGKTIARKCHHGFDMNVVFHNRSQVADAGVPATQLSMLSDVMSASDVVIIAVAANADTHHLIDAAALAAMRPHAYLVNISRGNVIDEAALIKALQNGEIAGAGLDVYEFEPAVPKTLLALENAVLLPHLGTNAEEVRSDMGQMAVDNLRAFFAGQPVPNKV